MEVRLTSAILACALGVATAATGAPRRPATLTLEGMWAVNFVLPMESAPARPSLVVSEGEARTIAAVYGAELSDQFAKTLDPELPMLVTQSDGLPIVRGQRRTRAVVQPADGRIPYALAVRKEAEGPPLAGSMDNPEQMTNAERCIVGSGQPPLSSFALDSELQILVTRDQVVLHSEYGDDVRIVPITDKHGPRALTGPLGDSIGRWEGKTLVVETVGLPDADRYRIEPTLIVPGEATVIERFTPISDRELLYQFTIVDPKAFTAPWLGEFSWFRTKKPIYESACHEGNYSLGNELAGARHEEAAARAAAKPAR
jgi:hypothetical protein